MKKIILLLSVVFCSISVNAQVTCYVKRTKVLKNNDTVWHTDILTLR